MPKTTKRAASRRAERIARAHATELTTLEVKDSTERRRSPGYKAPARGIARYPWASVIILCIILAAILGGMYAFHVPPFAQSAASKPNATPAAATQPHATPTPAATTTSSSTAASPCTDAKIVKAITRTGTPTRDEVSKINHTYSGTKQVIDNNKIYCAGINTSHGLIVVELDPKIAPKTVNNFVFLAQNHFYDGLTFHRVLTQDKDSIGIAQGGDPKGDGTGGPGYQFADEPVQGDYTAGTLAMANSGPNTNGSQFFINTSDNSKAFQKSYNLFGHIVQGLDIAKQIKHRDPNTQANVTPDMMDYVIVTAAS